MKKARIAAIAVCVLLCIVMAISLLFITLESDHACIGDECHICIELQICNAVLQGLAYAAIASIVLCFFARYFADILKYISPKNETRTLIALKIKLTN